MRVDNGKGPRTQVRVGCGRWRMVVFSYTDKYIGANDKLSEDRKGGGARSKNEYITFAIVLH